MFKHRKMQPARVEGYVCLRVLAPSRTRDICRGVCRHPGILEGLLEFATSRIADGEGDFEFRGIQLVVGDDAFGFFSEDVDAISALREFFVELHGWGVMAGHAEGGGDLCAMFGSAAYSNADLKIGVRLVDLEGGELTINLVTFASTPRTMATVYTRPVHLQELAASFEALLDAEVARQDDYF